MPTTKKDIAYTLGKDSTPYRVVSVLQEKFKEPGKTNAEGKVLAARKLQGRLLIGAVVESVFQYASPATLDALAKDAKDKGEKGGRASEYIAAIVGARGAAPTTAVNLETAMAQIAAAGATPSTIKQVLAEIAAVKTDPAPGNKTKGIAAL